MSSCLLHNPTNAVYIKRSHPSSSASTLCIFILAILFTLGSLDKLPTYCTSSPLPLACQVYRSSVMSRPPQTDARNSPSFQVNHRCPISILAMSTACTAPNQAIQPPSNLHSESHVGIMTRLNSPLAKQRSLIFVRHEASISPTACTCRLIINVNMMA